MDISIRQTQTQIKLSVETKFSFQPIAVKDVNFNLKNSGLSWCTGTRGNSYCFHIHTWSCDAVR